ncbi:MAG: F0F1 ATP synthase subunit A [Chitinophagaceae bacterium]|nr:F0F1 ATP synthase subunit A [Chitinophagaceae bacterium]MCW5913403.1 F0F1 ATP synthase subunit A [Chitinophagaceae bacterium]MCZ2395843.1 F0F1 ATP synthase subunit A [Chitinophagales bacterium]
MGIRSVKSLLVATFSIFLISISFQGFAQEGAHGEAKSEEKFDPTTVILHHVQDAYSFHFFTIGHFNASIPLPVILYSPQKGLSVFSSSRFGHEGELTFDGYKMVNGNKIVAVDEGVQVYDFSMTRNVVQTLLVCALFIILMINIANRYKKGIGVTSAPTGVQNLMEPVIIFIREEVAKVNLGSRWERYMPYLLTLFFFILVNTLFGLIPGVANVTGNIAFTLILGVIALIVILASTTGHFWKHLFWPPGVPFLVKLILIPVELAGVFIIKPGALIIRLFANMIAGHIVILAFISLIFIFGEMSTFAGYSFSPFSVVFIVFDYFIELLVAFIQAFIFTVLTAIFIGQGFEGSDHDLHPGTHDGML